MTDKTASVRTEEKEAIDMTLVNQGRYVFIGTIKRGDDVVAVIADRTLRSQAKIDSDKNAIASHNRVAFNNAAAIAPNIEGAGITYPKADELETRKASLQGADRETFKQAIHCIEKKKEALATAPLPAATRRLSAMPVQSGR